MPTELAANAAMPDYAEERPTHLLTGSGELGASLGLVPRPCGVVLIANDRGTSRHRCCELKLARELRRNGFATLMLDLLTIAEQDEDGAAERVRLDAMKLAHRISAGREWLAAQPELTGLPIALIGEGGAGAAALIDSAGHPRLYSALVLRSAQPLRAGFALAQMDVPRLLVVDVRDHVLVQQNRHALAEMQGEVELMTLEGVADRRGESCEPSQNAIQIARWIHDHLAGASRAKPGFAPDCRLAPRPSGALDH